MPNRNDVPVDKMVGKDIVPCVESEYISQSVCGEWKYSPSKKAALLPSNETAPHHKLDWSTKVV